jgi:hypothetical protein
MPLRTGTMTLITDGDNRQSLQALRVAITMCKPADMLIQMAQKIDPLSFEQTKVG